MSKAIHTPTVARMASLYEASHAPLPTSITQDGARYHRANEAMIAQQDEIVRLAGTHGIFDSYDMLEGMFDLVAQRRRTRREDGKRRAALRQAREAKQQERAYA